MIAILLAAASSAASLPQDAAPKVQICGERVTRANGVALLRADGSVALPLSLDGDRRNLDLVDKMIPGGTKDLVTYCVELQGEPDARVPVSIFQLSCIDPFAKRI